MGFAPQSTLAEPQAKASSAPARGAHEPQASRVGNQAALRRLNWQPKLEIGAVDDPLEREADAVAERVMRMPDPELSIAAASPRVNRKCAACEEEERLKEDGEPKLRRRAADGAGAGAAGTLAANTLVTEVLAEPGRPLDPEARAFFEPRFGLDFADVRIHTGAKPAAAAREIGARAFTFGSHVALRGDEAGGGEESRRLLAHELTHVAQQRGGRPAAVRRKTGDDDPLTGVSFGQFKSDPPTFHVTLAFEKGGVNFDANLVGSLQEKAPGEGVEHISATSLDATDPVQAEGVAFALSDHANRMIWVDPVDLKFTSELARARAFLLEHDPAPLDIFDATKTSEPEKQEETPSPDSRFFAAEDWLEKEMKPSVQALLSKNHPEVKADNLVAYRSTAIQAKEGDDVSMLQIETGTGAAKKIAGHVRVLRSKWVNQAAEAQTSYATETADAIARKLVDAARASQLADLDKQLKDQDKTAQAFPPWAIALRKDVQGKLDSTRAAADASAPPQDLPDRIHLTRLGEEIRFEIFISQKAANDSDKTVWNHALASPALNEDLKNDVAGLVDALREQTAALRARPINIVDNGDDALTNVLMPALPATIDANINANGATVTEAENHFRMTIRFADVLSAAGGRDTLNLMGLAQSLGLSEIDYTWKFVRLTSENATYALRQPPKGAAAEQTPASDPVADFADPSIDQPTKIAAANRIVDAGAIVAGASPVADVDHGEMDFKFPAVEGVYLAVCSVTPRPLVDDSLRKIFPPSRAVLPVRVLTSANLARESVDKDNAAIKGKERALADPALSEQKRLETQRDLDKLKSEEGLSQADLTRKAQTDVESKIARFQALKTWLIDDRSKHQTTLGNATEDPLLVRMTIFDKVHETHYFEDFGELVSAYGEAAYDFKGLSEAVDSPEGQANTLNKHIASLQSARGEAQKLADLAQSEEQGFLGGKTRRAVATLVARDTGKTIPLVLLVGQSQDSKEGAFQYRILDLTLATTILFKEKDQIYVGDVCANETDAVNSAFAAYGKQNQYNEGTLYYRFAGDQNLLNVVNARPTLIKYAERASMILALIAAIGAVAASGGAAAPGLAAVMAVIGAANAVVAIALAGANVKRRGENGTLEMDADIALDVINVLASLVGLGVAGKTAQLGKVAGAAGAASRAAAAAATIERIGRLMLIFDTTVLGATAVITAVKVSDDVKAVKNLKLPPAQEDAMLKEIAADAMMQGAMLAFQSVMLARAHMEALKSNIENTRYQNMEERGWLDKEGHVTESAPPSLRASARGEAPLGAENQTFDLETDLKAVRQSIDDGRGVNETADPSYDLTIPFEDAKGETHELKRQREGGTWCRHSSNPFCFISRKDIDRIAAAIAGVEELKKSVRAPDSVLDAQSRAAMPEPRRQLVAGTGLIEKITASIADGGGLLVKIAGIVKPGLLPRKAMPNFNQMMRNRFGNLVKGLQWCHLWGPGFGDEASAGMFLGPESVNQLWQNGTLEWSGDSKTYKGIESFIRDLASMARAQGGELYLEASADSWPPGSWPGGGDDGIKLLKSVKYEFKIRSKDGVSTKSVRIDMDLPHPSQWTDPKTVTPTVQISGVL